MGGRYELLWPLSQCIVVAFGASLAKLLGNIISAIRRRWMKYAKEISVAGAINSALLTATSIVVPKGFASTPRTNPAVIVRFTHSCCVRTTETKSIPINHPSRKFQKQVMQATKLMISDVTTIVPTQPCDIPAGKPIVTIRNPDQSSWAIRVLCSESCCARF